MACRVVLLATSWAKPISILISASTGEQFSHAGIILPDQRVIDASETRGAIGIRQHGVHDWGSRNILVMDISTDVASDALVDLMAMDGLRYDWRGVFGWIFSKRNLGLDSDWYCFELVEWFLNRLSGTPPTGHRVSARHVLVHPLTNVVYYGPANRYLTDPSEPL
jgi:hypothetical protein